MKKGIMQRDEMRAPSASLARLRGDDDRLRNDEDPYQNLANAIICVAADDYRTALKKDDKLLKSSLQRFFRSTWCRVLTSIDTELLMESIHKEHQGSLTTVNV